MLEVGEAPTECPNAANRGVTCTSARDVWEMTNNKTELTPGTVGNDVAAGDVDAEPQQRAPYPGGTPAERKEIYSEYQQNRNSMAAPEPIAVRQRAKVLRVLMNSWEDDFGRLHMPGYTYVEIEKRKWVVGRGATTNPARITPLSIRKQSLTEERKNNPTADNGMGIIQRQPIQQ
jgi:conjugal transfer pilus assembly protein TraV